MEERHLRMPCSVTVDQGLDQSTPSAEEGDIITEHKLYNSDFCVLLMFCLLIWLTWLLQAPASASLALSQSAPEPAVQPFAQLPLEFAQACCA